VSDGAPIYDPYASSRHEGGSAEVAASEPVRTSAMAIWSLVLGVLGFVCFPAVGGFFALTLGAVAKGEIARSHGTRTGSGLAIGGMVLGALNVLASAAALALLLSYASSPTTATPSPAPVFAPPPVSPMVPAPAPSPAPSATASAQSSREPGVIATRVGKLELVDVDRDVPSLSRELEAQRKAAAKDGKRLLVWVVVDDCMPCNGVAAALGDPSMQTALEKVRVVRVNSRDFGQDLTFLGIPVAKVPGFALLGDGNRPEDYVNGGEWDDDIPRNIAPVLGNFVRGRYTKRREQWRGPRRDDETTL